ncbi:S-methyl-5-thioribose-1-phosphate isomerase [Methanocella sp. CWC-04]|uniref:Putative methylthioribose-1-phosphate isomerase n=1 Tax=Methanooceanicella nereidis TaxID=2052831 RepID=A0AAP2W4U9_9EURY|nr:S-methyl-5-thioribose-1-phosphate isomerase [Methanocella sp. CWC-04]MCD1293698.1 S-methyl-5-thioribose-1-phosphate isomerase [Methanocella sp. CWC-04]
MRTIYWDDKKGCVTLVDQTALPVKLLLLDIHEVRDLEDAILKLKVRGAPALGAAGGFGVALLAYTIKSRDIKEYIEKLMSGADELKGTRPTAVNLSWGVERTMRKALTGKDISEIQSLALEEAKAIADDDVARCKAIGEHGSKLLEDGDTVMTHCNAGRMACVDWGTALGVIRSAVAEGKKIKVISCETRPLNQGCRITTWELMEDGIPVTLITDSMSGHVMRKGMVDKVIVGADRIVEDAVFNKIGTYTHSVVAKAHGIPFYVAAPFSTFDFTKKEKDVVIEERSGDELRYWGGMQIAPKDVQVYNPAFDATPMENVTAIITELGILKPPMDFSEIKKKFNI